MDDMYIIYGVMLFGFIGAWLLGRYLDPYWRTKILRNITKKNYFMINILSKDNHLIKTFVVDIEDSIIKLKDNIWIVTNGKIYNKTQPEKQTNVSTSDKVKSEQSVPVIYLSEDTLIPLDFQEQESKVTPKEVDSIFATYLANQLRKIQVNSINQYVMITFFVCILCLGVCGYTLYQFMTFQDLIKTGQFSIQYNGNATTSNLNTTIVKDKVYISGS